MAVNYDDKRFTEVENDKKEALTEIEETYGGMINKSDKYFTDQINASKEWAETQKKLQNENTDFAIEKIEQQKDQAHKDYTKEQSGAYVDWQKQSNQYGANAEQMASAGLTNTGFSESSQVSMYNTYQNRVSAAREAYTRAVLNYDNAIKEAQLQNNSVLAEIAYNALQQQLKLSLEGFQYKNTLVLEKSKAVRETKSEYYNRWKDVLAQINTENALAEQQRQFDAQMAEEKRQFDILHPGTSSIVGKTSKAYNSSGFQAYKSPKANAGKAIANDQGAKSYYVDGLGNVSKEKFDSLYKKGIIVETKKDGSIGYRTTIPKSSLEIAGLWRD